MKVYANDFFEIPKTLERNHELRDRVLRLVREEPMPGKVTEGAGRLDTFKSILSELVQGRLSLEQSYDVTLLKIPQHGSIHRSNARVFPNGWSERLVRTQLSRFYNQAVMEMLLEEGENMCFVPHSEHEDSQSECSRHLAGKNQNVRSLYDSLLKSYRDGVWLREVKIPNHPHCTHVVVPLSG